MRNPARHSHARRRDLATLGGALFAAAALAGCDRGGANVGDTLLLRFAMEEPEATFDPAVLRTERTVLEWKARESLPTGPIEIRLPARGLRAGAVGVVEATIGGPRRDFRRRGAVRLIWTSDATGAEWHDSQLQARSEVGEYEGHYRFEVGTHARWRGTITRLRVEPSVNPEDGAAVRAVRLLSLEPRPAAAAPLAGRPWRVRIGDDLRTGFLAPPEASLERVVTVPDRASLRFGYGVTAPTTTPVAFEVFVGDATEAAFSETLGPGGPNGRWHEANLDLSPWSGRRVRLTLRTRAAGAPSADASVPVWGHPEIWVGGRPRPTSVVVIVVDTLRADRLSLYGHQRRTSPHLDRWADQNAVVFERAYAPSPWTLPSHASLFTGLDAVRHGVNQGYPLPSSLPTLTEVFRRAGYATVAVTGGVYLTPEFGFARGFDRFSAWRGDDELELQSGVERALATLDRLGSQPFFLFFHTYEVHAPFRPRQPYFGSFGGDLSQVPESLAPAMVPPRPADGYRVRQRLQRGALPATAGDQELLDELYDAGVAYTDAALGRLLERVGRIDPRPIVVVTSDHGEALGERGLAGHTHLYDFNLRVPLLISAPGLRPRRVASRARLIDLAPTLTDLTKLAPLRDIDGATLRPLLLGQDEPLEREVWSYASSTNQGIALRRGSSAYLFDNTAWTMACGREELYDLAADPEESSDLAPQPPAPELRRRTARHLETWSSGLLVRFLNQSATTPFQGTLSSPFLHQVRIKSWGTGCPDIAWREATGDVAFRVAAGRRYGLLLEGVADEPLRISCGGRTVDLRPEELIRPRAIAWASGGCTELPEGTALPPIGLTIQWTGDPRARQTARPPSQSDVLDRLRALGYVQ